jgi:phosphocarrier protein
MTDNPHYAEAEVTIVNEQGLHARPILRFVDQAAQFGSKIVVIKDSQRVDGKSPMEMMLLAAVRGTKLRLIAEGEDARQAISALRGLIQGGFGEN